MVLVKTEVGGHGAGHLLAVTREHDAALHARGMQVGDGLGGVVFHGVGDDDVACIRAVDRHMQDGSGEFAIGTACPSTVAVTP